MYWYTFFVYLSDHFVIIHIDKVTSIAVVAEICL